MFEYTVHVGTQNSGIQLSTVGLTETNIAPVFNNISTNIVDKFEVVTGGDGYLELFTDDYNLDGEVKTIIVTVTSTNDQIPQELTF